MKNPVLKALSIVGIAVVLFALIVGAAQWVFPQSEATVSPQLPEEQPDFIKTDQTGLTLNNDQCTFLVHHIALAYDHVILLTVEEQEVAVTGLVFRLCTTLDPSDFLNSFWLTTIKTVEQNELVKFEDAASLKNFLDRNIATHIHQVPEWRGNVIIQVETHPVPTLEWVLKRGILDATPVVVSSE